MKDAIFISGISRGIGLELADLFCSEGYPVYGIGRSPEPERSIQGLTYRSIAAEKFSVAAFPELSGQTFATIMLNSAVFGPANQYSLDFPVARLKAMFETNVIS